MGLLYKMFRVMIHALQAFENAGDCLSDTRSDC